MRKVRAVTASPKYHFFGYYGICPWNASGKYLLSLEIDFDDHPPTADDLATVGVIETASGKFIPIAQTYAWNNQQGSMLHWWPGDPESTIIYNERQGDRFVSVLRNIETGRVRVLPRAICAMSHNGKTALSLNFSRLAKLRPGYGYEGVPDPYEEVVHPDRDGIWIVDLETGEAKLLVSIAQARAYHSSLRELDGRTMWFNHVLYNPTDTRFLFFARWRRPDSPRNVTAVFTVGVDGSDLRCVLPFEKGGSHFEWRNERELVVTTRLRPDAAPGELDFALFEDKPGEIEYRTPWASVLHRDGHPSFSPDGRWLLADSYPDDQRMQMLWVLNADTAEVMVQGKFYSPPQYTGVVRCDLHPRWNRDGTQVCFDGVHEDGLQLYVMDLDLPRR